MPTKLIVITDCAFGYFLHDPDDGLALWYLLTNPNVEIEAMVSTFGNVSEKYTFKSISKITKIISKNIPVVHGPKSKEDIIQLKESVDYVFKLLKSNPKNITILSLGPLTLLSNLVDTYPESMNLWKKVIVMGGLGNTRHPFYPFIKEEHNFRKDLKSTNNFLSKYTPELVTLEETHKIIYGIKEIKSLPIWIKPHLLFWYFLNRLVGKQGFHPHDLTAAETVMINR